jgi:hypothetical protein
MRWLATLALSFAVAGWVLAGCGDSCETDGDCLIACDCNLDGTLESIFPHDCTDGHCGVRHQRDLEEGCEVLCSEGY